MYVFFFKQRTAYEVRICDWSSDVCSSDLPVPGRHQRQVFQQSAGRAGGHLPGLDLAVAVAPRAPVRLSGPLERRQCVWQRLSVVAFADRAGPRRMAGRGLGSQRREIALPARAHTDFLMAVVGEELGFAGVMLVIMLFAVIIQRGFAIG